MAKATHGILVIAGSDAPEARAQLERLAEAGALTLTLTREAVLGQDETLLMALRSAAGAAVKEGRPVVVRSENWPGAVEVTRRLAAKRYIPEIEQRVATMLGRVAEGVVKAGAGSRLIVVGTDTGEAVCRQLQITERAVTREVAPGLPVLRA
ncbi:MAG TPA: nucleotide-binding domain containing protein, partial [Symbiobacteriaceae bacterium]|nr:nucleotide-binding domain containing protein [Symbiobacteriaceae bacterium]